MYCALCCIAHAYKRDKEVPNRVLVKQQRYSGGPAETVSIEVAETQVTHQNFGERPWITSFAFTERKSHNGEGYERRRR